MTAMMAAGASHWWSVHQFAGMLNHGIAIAHQPTVAPVSDPASPASVQSPSPLANHTTAQQAAASITAFSTADTARQKEFYEALIGKLSQVETQNRDLLDQLAETNRDLMKLEFRVDTHSESFRPLPLVEEQPFSNLDINNGVLPPRSNQPGLPTYQ